MATARRPKRLNIRRYANHRERQIQLRAPIYRARSNIQIGDRESVFFNKFSARLHLVAH